MADLRFIECLTSLEQAQGLQFWRELPQNVVLIFPLRGSSTFHMKNVRFPIGIASVVSGELGPEIRDHQLLGLGKTYEPHADAEFVLEFHPELLGNTSIASSFTSAPKQRYRDVVHEFLEPLDLRRSPFFPLGANEWRFATYELIIGNDGRIVDALRIKFIDGEQYQYLTGKRHVVAVKQERMSGKVEHAGIRFIFAKPDVMAGDLFFDGSVYAIIERIEDNGIVHCAIGNTPEEASRNKAQDKLHQELIEEFANMKLIDRPLRIQHQDYTCGPAALQYVLNHLGIDASEAEIANKTATTADEGTSVNKLGEFLKNLDVKHRLLSGDVYEQFSDDQDKFIIALIHDRGTNHFVVVLNVFDNHVLFFDPYDSGTKKYPKSQFDQFLVDHDETPMIEVLL